MQCEFGSHDGQELGPSVECPLEPLLAVRAIFDRQARQKKSTSFRSTGLACRGTGCLPRDRAASHALKYSKRLDP